MSTRIGLFLHSAFPNSQIVQILPQREELLKSMLCSDLIGFHLFEYAKNFVTTCKKLLDLNYEFRRGGCLGIDVDGSRYVSLKIGHVGIEKECVNEVITSQDFTKCFDELFSENNPVYGKQIFAGIDYLHPMSGVTNKLRAFYEFLKSNPSRSQEVQLVQYLVPIKGNDEKIMQTIVFKKMTDEISELTTRINQEFGDNTIQIYQNGASKAQRCALWARAEYLFITCYRDGLCLVIYRKSIIQIQQPLEYLAVKQFLGRMHDSSIIISEFAGVSQALHGIHTVNPQNNQLLIAMALKSSRMISTPDSHYWVQFAEYKQIKTSAMDQKSLGQSTSGDQVNQQKYQQAHLTRALIFMESGSEHSQDLVHKKNPSFEYDQINEIKQKLEFVWQMTSEAKLRLIESSLRYLDQHSTLKWAHSFLKDLKRSHQPTMLSYFMGATYGQNNKRLISNNQDFVLINDAVQQVIINNYIQKKNRLIIIDHEGTIPRKYTTDPEPAPEVLKILDHLTRDKRNTVFIVSPHSGRQVHAWFSQPTRNAGLASDDGYLYRFNSLFKSEYEWQRLIEIGLDFQNWMGAVEDLMKHYVANTDGASIEKKESTIVFDFADSDNHFGHLIARELAKQIDILISNGYPIQCVVGQTYLEVKPKELKKVSTPHFCNSFQSLLLDRIISAISNKSMVDFILYIGDDSSNEEVFSYLKTVQKSTQNEALIMDQIFTCTVGKKPSNAQYFMKDSVDMCNLLRNLSQSGRQTQVKGKRRRNKSTTSISVKNHNSAPPKEQEVPLKRDGQSNLQQARSSSAPRDLNGTNSNKSSQVELFHLK